ncbi:MAG: 16S rRNA (guanine(966)-N(2))-methyltransferase RsmD [Hyphomicrobiaceae bacterium]
MRIVAGKFRGRALAAPEHEGLRPTADRVRESIFNILAHGTDDFDLAGARVIDLFAGTGALGLEAMSRGAAYCLFVEDSAQARGLIRQNIEAFGLMGETRIFRRDACDLGPAGNIEPFDLAFLDPPYGKGLAEKSLQSLVQGGWLIDGAICVVEDRIGVSFTIPTGLIDLDQRFWGDTLVRFLRRD